MQNHYNLVYREEEREMMPLCREEGIGVIPWSPLARGFLAGNRKRGVQDATQREQHDNYGHSLYYTEADYDIADRVVQVARKRACCRSRWRWRGSCNSPASPRRSSARRGSSSSIS